MTEVTAVWAAVSVDIIIMSSRVSVAPITDDISELEDVEPAEETNDETES